MIRKHIFAFFLMLALVPAAGAWELDYLVGAQAGYEESIDEGSGDFVWGGFARMRFTDYIGVEAMADVTSDDFLDETVNTDNVTVMGNLLLYPIPDIFYLSAGAGWTRADIAYPAFEDEREDHFAWNAGAGMEIPVVSWLSIVVDARYVFRELDFDNNAAAADADLNTDFWMVRGGLAIRFCGDDKNGW